MDSVDIIETSQEGGVLATATSPISKNEFPIFSQLT